MSDKRYICDLIYPRYVMYSVLRRDRELFLFTFIQIIYNVYFINLFLLHSLGLLSILVLITVFFLSSIFLVKMLDEYLGGWSKAKGDELFREDNKLLSGVTLLQAVLLIFLDRFQFFSEEIYPYVVVETVLITLLFYITRTYAHIRDDSKWRLRSIHIITTVISPDISYCMIVLFKKYLPNIGSQTVNLFSIIVMITVIPLYLTINKLFETRYGSLH